MSSLSSFSSIQFKDDNFPLLSKTTFDQQFIEKDGNFIPISNLVILPQILASIGLPPNATTLRVIDTLLLDNSSSSITNTIDNVSMVISDSASGLTNTFNSSSLFINDVMNGYSNDIGRTYISMFDNNGGNPLTIDLSTDHTLDPSPKISLQNNSGVSTIVKNDTLIINNAVSGVVNTLNYFSMYINDAINGYSNDIGNSYMSMLDANGGNPLTISLSTDHTLDPSPTISLQNSSGLTTMKSDNLTIDAFTIGGPKNTLTAGDIQIQDYTATMVSLLSADGLTLTYSSASQINLVSVENRLLFIDNTSGANFSFGTDILSGTHMSNIISNSSDIFVNSNTKQFFKFNNAGYSYKPLLSSQDQTIQRYMNYVVMDDGVTNVILDSYTNLLDSDTTLPDIDRVGWSCKFSNLNNTDATISNVDGLNYSSHHGGLSAAPYTLKRWSVVELTLIWSNTLSQYLFAVSQY
jgi:hypothetical protein